MTKSLEKMPKKRKKGTLTKSIILEVSAKMFQEKGYDRTSLDGIARALSITKPSLYYHFSNKEAILLECVTLAYLRFQEEIGLRDNVSLTGRERMEILLKLYLEVITDDIGVSMVLADDRVMSKEGQKKFHNFRRVLNADLEDRMKLAIADGSVVASETRLTTYAIFGMFNWVGHWHFRQNRIPVDEIFDRFKSVIFDGIAASPTNTAPKR